MTVTFGAIFWPFFPFYQQEKITLQINLSFDGVLLKYIKNNLILHWVVYNLKLAFLDGNIMFSGVQQQKN